MIDSCWLGLDWGLYIITFGMTVLHWGWTGGRLWWVLNRDRLWPDSASLEQAGVAGGGLN